MSAHTFTEAEQESVYSEELLYSLAEVTRKHRVVALTNLLNSITHIQKQLVQIRISSLYSDSAFSQLILSLPEKRERQHAEDFYTKLFIEIESVLPDPDNLRHLVQDEARFQAQRTESFRLKYVKTLKNITRSIYNAPVRAYNRAMEIAGRDAADYRVWTHRMYPGKLARLEVYNQAEIIESWIHNDLKFYRDLVLIVDRLFTDMHEHLNISGTVKNGGNEIQDVVQKGLGELKNLRAAIRKTIAHVEIDSRFFSEKIYDNLLINAGRAGTLELPDRFYNEKRLRKKRHAAIDRLSDQSAVWYIDYNAQADRVQASKSIYGISYRLKSASATLISSLNTLFNERLIKELKHVKLAFDSLHKDFDSKKAAGKKKTIHESIGKLKIDLKAKVIDPLISHLDENFSKMPVFESAETFINDVLSSIEKVPGEINLISRSDTETIPPYTETEEIHLRRSIDAFIRNDIIRDIKPLTYRMESFIAGIHKDLLELTNITDVNLNMAEDVLEDSDDDSSAEALKLVAESLDRIGNRLDSTLKKMDFERNGSVGIVQKDTEDAIVYLSELVLQRKLINLKWKTRELEVRSTARGWREQVIAKGQSSREAMALWIRFTGTKSNDLGLQIRNFLGYQNTSVGTIKTDVSNYLAETGRRLNELPLIYRRLFSFDPLDDRRFLAGRQFALNRYDQAFSNWSNGLFANVIFIGERGSGKTTLVNMITGASGAGVKLLSIHIEHTINEEDILIARLCEVLNLEQVQGVDSFIEAVNGMEERALLIFEGFQNLYLRNINGFSALECFLLIISRTSHKIFWIVTSSKYAWKYLNKVFRTSEYFTDIIICDELNKNDIKELILIRHAMSGYELLFGHDYRIAQSRSFKKLKGDFIAEQQYLSERYFDELSEIAEGNATIAIIYWLRSVSETDSTRITIAPLDESKVQMSADLSEDALFSLAAILMHDDLTAEQLSLVLNISSDKSRLLLSRMTSRSIFYEKDGRYYLNNMLYRHATRITSGKNILH